MSRHVLRPGLRQAMRFARVAAEEGGVWTPADLTGLTAWYDFSDATTLYTDAGSTNVTANDDLIYQVNDKSGGAYHLRQATEAKRPLYKTNSQNSLSTGDFNGSSQFMQSISSLALSQPLTIAVVVDLDVVNETRGLIAVDAQVYTRASKWTIYAGTRLDGPATSTNCDIVAAVFNGASSKCYVNGGVPVTANAGPSGAAAIVLGANSSSPSNYTDGRVAEMVVVSGAMSAADMNTLAAYLSAKWATSAWTDVS